MILLCLTCIMDSVPIHIKWLKYVLIDLDRFPLLIEWILYSSSVSLCLFKCNEMILLLGVSNGRQLHNASDRKLKLFDNDSGDYFIAIRENHPTFESNNFQILMEVFDLFRCHIFRRARCFLHPLEFQIRIHRFLGYQQYCQIQVVH